MKKALVLLVLLVQLVRLGAQSPFTLEWHGFVNPHFYADSRAVVGGREDMMLFYPKPIVKDSLGNDINDGWQANLLAITARLGLRINGPDMLGAKTSAYIEGDFTGSTNATIDNLRLRHAYIDMRWEHHRLLMGQYWYAMTVHEIMPMTNPLNMGAPFHCYARQPQVRYEYRLDGFEAVAVAQWQLDNMSQGLLNGTLTSSTLFARHSLIPELNAQLRLYHEGLLFGVATNLKTIQPVVNTDASASLRSSTHSSLTWSFFGRLNLGSYTVKAQALLNNSLYEGCSLGGYVMWSYSDGVLHAEDWHFNTLWIDVERRTGHWRPGLFMGYALNRDRSKTGHSSGVSSFYLFGRGSELEYLWRVQPRLTYKTLKGLDFTAEAEYTRAGYAHPVGNLRLSLSAVYAF